MKVGIIDADLNCRSRHRFPNLACMKISGYHKELGDDVTLITSYPSFQLTPNHIKYYKQNFDKIYVSKVFVDSQVPYELLNMDIVTYGGTGFFYSDAEPLSPIIENHMPDYTLYNDFIQQQKELDKSDKEFKYYENYSIGFSTRGCVRGCKFCINKNSRKVCKATSLSNFLDQDRLNICLLDDNILAYENWREVLEELNNTGKKFEFKQGFDIRALNEEKAEVLANSNLMSNTIYFAFDNIKDKEIIETNLQLWRKYYRKNTSMYILCGFDEDGVYDDAFYAKDIENTFERIRICIKYGIMPYIMRYQKYKNAPEIYKGMYINLSCWCNQKAMFVKYSLEGWANFFQEFTEKQSGKKFLYSNKRYNMVYAGTHPDIAYEYYGMNFEEHNEYKYEKGNQLTTEIGTKEQSYPKKLLIKETSTPSKKEEKIIQLEDLQGNKTENKILRCHISELKRIDSKIILINSKTNELNELTKKLILYHEHINSNANIFIYNKDLKSFSNTKEFIENNTNLIYREVVTIKTISNKNTVYCSRYSMADDKNIFNVDESYNYLSLLKNICENKSKENDNIVSYYDNNGMYRKLGDVFNVRKWSCFSAHTEIDSNRVIAFIENTLDKDKTKQLELETTNIG